VWFVYCYCMPCVIIVLPCDCTLLYCDWQHRLWLLCRIVFIIVVVAFGFDSVIVIIICTQPCDYLPSCSYSTLYMPARTPHFVLFYLIYLRLLPCVYSCYSCTLWLPCIVLWPCDWLQLYYSWLLWFVTLRFLDCPLHLHVTALQLPLPALCLWPWPLFGVVVLLYVIYICDCTLIYCPARWPHVVGPFL